MASSRRPSTMSFHQHLRDPFPGREKGFSPEPALGPNSSSPSKSYVFPPSQTTVTGSIDASLLGTSPPNDETLPGSSTLGRNEPNLQHHRQSVDQAGRSILPDPCQEVPPPYPFSQPSYPAQAPVSQATAPPSQGTPPQPVYNNHNRTGQNVYNYYYLNVSSPHEALPPGAPPDHINPGSLPGSVSNGPYPFMNEVDPLYTTPVATASPLYPRPLATPQASASQHFGQPNPHPFQSLSTSQPRRPSESQPLDRRPEQSTSTFRLTSPIAKDNRSQPFRAQAPGGPPVIRFTPSPNPQEREDLDSEGEQETDGQHRARHRARLLQARKLQHEANKRLDAKFDGSTKNKDKGKGKATVKGTGSRLWGNSHGETLATNIGDDSRYSQCEGVKIVGPHQHEPFAGSPSPAPENKPINFQLADPFSPSNPSPVSGAVEWNRPPPLKPMNPAQTRGYAFEGQTFNDLLRFMGGNHPQAGPSRAASGNLSSNVPNSGAPDPRPANSSGAFRRPSKPSPPPGARPPTAGCDPAFGNEVRKLFREQHLRNHPQNAYLDPSHPDYVPLVYPPGLEENVNWFERREAVLQERRAPMGGPSAGQRRTRDERDQEDEDDNDASEDEEDYRARKRFRPEDYLPVAQGGRHGAFYEKERRQLDPIYWHGKIPRFRGPDAAERKEDWIKTRGHYRELHTRATKLHKWSSEVYGFDQPGFSDPLPCDSLHPYAMGLVKNIPPPAEEDLEPPKDPDESRPPNRNRIKPEDELPAIVPGFNEGFCVTARCTYETPHVPPIDDPLFREPSEPWNDPQRSPWVPPPDSKLDKVHKWIVSLVRSGRSICDPEYQTPDGGQDALPNAPVADPEAEGASSMATERGIDEEDGEGSVSRPENYVGPVPSRDQDLAIQRQGGGGEPKCPAPAVTSQSRAAPKYQTPGPEGLDSAMSELDLGPLRARQSLSPSRRSPRRQAVRIRVQNVSAMSTSTADCQTGTSVAPPTFLDDRTELTRPEFEYIYNMIKRNDDEGVAGCVQHVRTSVLTRVMLYFKQRQESSESHDDEVVDADIEKQLLNHLSKIRPELDEKQLRHHLGHLVCGVDD